MDPQSHLGPSLRPTGDATRARVCARFRPNAVGGALGHPSDTGGSAMSGTPAPQRGGHRVRQAGAMSGARCGRPMFVALASALVAVGGCVQAWEAPRGGGGRVRSGGFSIGGRSGGRLGAARSREVCRAKFCLETGVRDLNLDAS